MAAPPSCRTIDGSWTFSSLVAAYLDLALAYLFLCASTLAYIAAKFLSVFGRSLPCSCSAGSLFRDPLPPPPHDRHRHRHRRGPACLQGFLVDYPLAKVAGVHASVRRRFPFDTLCSPSADGGGVCYCCWDEAKLVIDRADSDYDDGGGGEPRALLEMGEGAESCSSVSRPGVSKSLSLPALEQGEEERLESYGRVGEPVEFKGKGVVHRERPPKLLHHRRPRRSLSMGIEKSPLGSPSTPLRVSWKGEGAASNPFGAGARLQLGGEEKSPAPVFTGANHNIPVPGNDSDLAEESASATESKPVDKDLSDSAKLVSGFDRTESGVIRDLKQALEEEKVARAALSLELEKERSSAATAADEAMAMILRLQEEKAAIEMEARQYQRMVEEKSAFDEEEMEILKEIIIRREREKHMLEKEVEAYRQMMLSSSDTEQPLGDGIHDASQLLEENESSLHSDATDMIAYIRGDDEKQSHTLENHDPGVLDHDDDCNVEDKGTVTMEVYPSPLQTKNYSKESFSYETTELQEKGFHESTSSSNCEETNVEDKEIKIKVPSDDLRTRHDLIEHQSTPSLSQFENEASILDVHVIDNKADVAGEGSTKVGLTPIQCASDISLNDVSRKEPSAAKLVDHPNKDSDTLCKKESSDIHRSCSDMTMAQSPQSSSQRASGLNLRRSSMSYVDSERFKLENEVELLRKRLKLIQQGREKLSFSAEQGEKEIYHLQLLEEISCQLQEIRKATEPGKSTRQILLPSSSQANVKKRRCRSVSIELNERI